MQSPPRSGERGEAAATARLRLARLADSLASPDPRAQHPQEVQQSDQPPQRWPSKQAHAHPDDHPGAPRAPATARHRAPSLSAGHRASSAVGDLLPAQAQRLRVERGLDAQHVAVVALVLAVLIALGAWWVLAGNPGSPQAVAPVAAGPHPVDQATPPTDPDPEADTAVATTPVTTPAAGTEPMVVVDVAGKVRRPGLVTLPAGSRVADALRSAGGASPGVDLTGLNLARLLVDGEQLLVGTEAATLPGAPPTPVMTSPVAPTVPVGAPVNVNTATLEQLDTLPGIGPVTAQSILDWRTANGSFTSVDELLEVDGIGDVTLADIRDLVTV